MNHTISFLLVAAALVGGCAYEPTYELTCADEGARDGDRVCSGGLWVASTTAVDMGGEDDVRVPVDMRVEPDLPPTCEPEPDEAFCARLGFTCDSVTAVDNCGVSRTADCGTCTGQATCGGGGTPNVCACGAQSDIEFCASYGKTCDPYTDVDGCGAMRTVNCGMCAGVETCAGDNTCTCDVVEACMALGANCGMVDVTGMCAGTNTITCGSCSDANASCAADNTCACDPGYTGNGLSCADVDECTTSADDCDPNASCANTPGSFTCTCDAGYTGDGKTCTAIPQAVTSVQEVQLSMANGDTSDTASITTVVSAQAVPFASMRLGDTDENAERISVDVFLSANNEVTISRDNGTGDVNVSAYVVEFNPTDAAVQSGTFSFTNFTGSVTIPNPVDRTKSFVVFYYENDNSTGNKDDFIVAGDLNASGSAIDFARGSNSGTISGHWWVVESQGTAFDVEHLQGSMSGLSTNIAVSNAPTAKSFLLYSYATDHNSNDADRAQAWCNLASPTNVQCRRSSDTDAVTGIRLQVVTLNGTESVQRGTEQINATTATGSAALQPAASASAMAFGGQIGAAGMTLHAATSGIQTPGGYFTQELVQGGSRVEVRRGTPRDGQASVTWQVIDW